MHRVIQNSPEYQKIKDRLEYAINGTNDGLWDWDLTTNEVYFSPRWKSMLGYEEDELENKLETWEKHVHPEDLKQALADIEKSHSDPNFEYNTIHRLRHKDGSWVWVLDRGQTYFDESGKAVRMVGFHTDITTIKQYEQELKEKDEVMIAQSRHAAMGEMMSMIAHQWRQPISVISMEANNVLMDIELDSLEPQILKESMEGILHQVAELSKTIDDFRDFFKPDQEVSQTTLRDVLQDALTIIGKSLENNGIKLIVDVDEDATITTHTRELMHVFINIIKNAKEMLLEKKIANKKIVVVIKKQAQCYSITICDNAGGVCPTIVDKIFEPYFTTKEQTNGTGLGLYMSKVIVEKHLLGSIGAYNMNDGACFEIHLPRDYQQEKRG